MTLVLQTNVLGHLSVWIVSRDAIIVRATMTVAWHGSDWMLRLVDQVLRKGQLSMSDMHSVIVVRGPGPFTAVRTGLLIANIISVMQRIPVSGVVRRQQLSAADVVQMARKPNTLRAIVRPWYGKMPNITKPKLHTKARR